MSTATLSLPNTHSAGAAYAPSIVHSYRGFGHVLCLLSACEDLFATRDPELVTCPQCQKVATLLAKPM